MERLLAEGPQHDPDPLGETHRVRTEHLNEARKSRRPPSRACLTMGKDSITFSCVIAVTKVRLFSWAGSHKSRATTDWLAFIRMGFTDWLTQKGRLSLIGWFSVKQSYHWLADFEKSGISLIGWLSRRAGLSLIGWLSEAHVLGGSC